ncbi:MAG: MFS transporter, partial [Pseudomonadales bacterium]|nr:MFS transporter [Pseudomonadales bacterium]
YIAMIFLGLAGVAGALLTTLNMSTMQLLIPQELRGRVNSLIMMAHGLMPLGVIPVGFVAEFFSIQTALLVGVVALLLSLTGIRLAYPELWRLGCIRTPYDPPGQERPEVPSAALAAKAN